MKDTNDIMMGKQLKSLRLITGCSQQQVAKKLKITIDKWQAYEDGEEHIPLRKMLVASFYCNAMFMTLLIIPAIMLPSRLKSQARFIKKTFIGSIGGK
jgi:transcriptional regulator with XRE-family HTH domain